MPATPRITKITDEELTWLSERVADLQARVRQVCEAHLSSLQSDGTQGA
jgi:hypothetical protein